MMYFKEIVLPNNLILQVEKIEIQRVCLLLRNSYSEFSYQLNNRVLLWKPYPSSALFMDFYKFLPHTDLKAEDSRSQFVTSSYSVRAGKNLRESFAFPNTAFDWWLRFRKKWLNPKFKTGLISPSTVKSRD